MSHVLIVGSLALDSLETPFGAARDVIGGAGVYASTAASFFSPVQLVGIVGDDYPLEALEFLESRQVDLQGVQIVSGGQSFRWAGRYEYDMNAAETLSTELGVFADFHPVLPEAYRSAQYVFLANITPAVQLSVLEQVEAPAFVMADTMNFWIESSREDLLRVLARVDMMLLNDAEIRQLTGIPNLARASQEVLAMGPRYVMVKKGEYGATLVSGDFSINLPCYPLPDVVDPTGAGDSFAVRRATAIATVMASRCVEQFGLAGLVVTSAEDLAHRYALLRSMVELSDISGL